MVSQYGEDGRRVREGAYHVQDDVLRPAGPDEGDELGGEGRGVDGARLEDDLRDG